MNVALLGGSFNPPHVGHLLAAVYVRSVVGCDEVWLLPSFHHPFGKALAPFEDRVEMCRLLGRDVGPWFKVSRAEASAGGEGRTIELLEYLLPRNPGVSFQWVIGSDIVAELPKWKSWDVIAQMVRVLVLHRAGYPVPGAIGPPLAQVSSSEIRQLLEAGQHPASLVPQAVLEYAQRKGLYGLAGEKKDV